MDAVKLGKVQKSLLYEGGSPRVQAYKEYNGVIKGDPNLPLDFDLFEKHPECKPVI